MTAVWEDLKGLITNPRDTLEGILARQTLILSMVLGAAGYYWRTLQISELLFAPAGGMVAFLAANCLIALGWMLLLVFLIHLACRLVGHKKGRWRDLFLVWGYTQVPTITVTVVTVAFFALVPRMWERSFEIAWGAPALAVTLLLSLWGLILKLQAIKISYDLSGWRLIQTIVVALVLYGIVASVEFIFLAERALVPENALRAMTPTVDPLRWRQNYVSLPFDKLTYRMRSARRGEIVGFVPPGRTGFPAEIRGDRVRFIGRVVGMPGDEVEVRKGRVYLNGRPYDEPYRVGEIDGDIAPTQVLAGHYFILGDNRGIPPEEYHGGLISEATLRGRLTDVGRTKWELLIGKGRW